MIKIIPAIDIMNGQCVRLTRGDFSTRQEYSSTPADIAKMFVENGFSRIHLVDLDGARQGKVVNWKILEQIASIHGAEVDFGGGVKTLNDAKKILDAGAKYITVGSVAAKNPEFMLEMIHITGPEKWILGMDLLNGKIAINGWTETTALEPVDFVLKYRNAGVDYFLCTEISKDGMLQGTDVELYQNILDKHKGIRLIASGGVGCMDDISILDTAGVPEVVIGKAIYEGKISITELAEYMKLC